MDWEGQESMLVLQYEKLSDFYFICGRLDHMEKNCFSVMAAVVRTLDRIKGKWLRLVFII